MAEATLRRQAGGVFDVCSADESFPIFSGDLERIHWSFAGPSQAIGTGASGRS